MHDPVIEHGDEQSSDRAWLRKPCQTHDFRAESISSREFWSSLQPTRTSTSADAVYPALAATPRYLKCAA